MRRPLLTLGATFALGVCAVHTLAYARVPIGSAAAMAAGLAAVACLAWGSRRQPTSVWLFAAAACLAGVSRAAFDEAAYVRARPTQFAEHADAAVTGVVRSAELDDEGATHLVADLAAAKPGASGSSRFRALYRPAAAGTPWLPLPGDRVEAVARWHPPPAQANPGGRDGELSHRATGTHGTWILEEGFGAQTPAGAAWQSRRAAAAARAAVVMGFERRFADRPQLGALLAGIVLGGSARLDERDLAALRDTGLVHAIAVSGLNVALVTGTLWILLASLRAPRRAAAIVLIPCAFAYAGLCGFSAPVVRAAVMTSFVLAAVVLDRDVDLGSAVAGAGAFSLMAEPEAALQLSFQLSFACTAALAALSGPLERSLPIPWRPVRSLLAGSLAAQAGVVPLVAFHFSSLSLVAPLANLVAVPLLGLLLALGLLLGALEPIAPAIAAPFAETAAWLLQRLLGWAHALASIPGAALHPPSMAPAGVVAVYAAGGFAVAGAFVRRRRRVFGTFSIGLVLCTSTFELIGGTGVGRPRIAFLAVGQGDSILVTSASGARILVDGGPGAPGDAGRAIVVPLLRKAGITRLDAVVCTHAHADHCGGLAAVLEAFPAALLVDSGQVAPESSVWSRYRAVAGQARVVRRVVAGDRIDGIPGVSMDVLWPREPALGGTRSDANNNSIVMRATLASDGAPLRLLLAADVEEEALALLLSSRDRYEAFACDVVKIPHHGGRRAEPRAVARAAGAALAVACVGRGNAFGMPHVEAVAAYVSAGARVARTDRDGAVLVRGGESIEVETWQRDGRGPSGADRVRRLFRPVRLLL